MSAEVWVYPDESGKVRAPRGMQFNQEPAAPPSSGGEPAEVLVEFQSMGAAGELVAQQFLDDVRSSTAKAPKALCKAVRKKDMKLTCFQAQHASPAAVAAGPLYLIMVVGHSDFILEKLGNESGM